LSSVYRQDVDGLRALAILPVVLFHFFPTYVPGGFVGVDVFFVISGFLISKIIFEGLSTNNFQFSIFYLNRVRRIFPALLLVLVSSLVLGWFLLLPDELSLLGKHVFSGAFFVLNFALLQEAGYFDVSTELKPLMHLWSLAVEEQFYILYPLIIWLGFRLRRFRLLAMLCLSLLSLLACFLLVRDDPVSAFFLPHLRFWELLSGALLAYAQVFGFAGQKWQEGWKALAGNGMSAVGLGLIVLSFFIIDKQSVFPGWLTLLPVVGAVLVIAAGSTALPNRILLAHPLPVFVGLISYPLYLWHWPIITFARIAESGMPSREVRVALVVLSVVLAWLTFKLLETPLRKASLRARFLLVVMMIVCGGAGAVVWHADGFPARYEAEELRIAEAFSHPYPEVTVVPCATVIGEQFPSSFQCSLSSAAEPRLALIGDSHAGQYLHAFFDNFDTVPVMAVAEPTCLPFSSMQDKGDCQKQVDGLLHYLQSSSVDTIYLAGYWSYLMSGSFVQQGDRWRIAGPLTAESRSVFLKNGRHFLRSLSEAGKNVVLLRDIPDLDFDIRSCFVLRGRSSFASVRPDCSIEFDAYQERMKPFDAVMTELLLEFSEVRIYDPLPAFCHMGRCMAASDGYPYYFNGDHLNFHGAKRALIKLFESEVSR